MSQVPASDCAVAELESADAVVIDTPMHRFTVPSALKAWIEARLSTVTSVPI